MKKKTTTERLKKTVTNGAEHVLSGANMDIDLLPGAPWKTDACPWNAAEGNETHRCAVKNTSICKYFRGVEKWDKVHCTYPEVRK